MSCFSIFDGIQWKILNEKGDEFHDLLRECEMYDVDRASSKLLSLMFDKEAETKRMKEKVQRVASSHLRTDKQPWEGVGVPEELYQWSKSL
jgi:hypothetical protein